MSEGSNLYGEEIVSRETVERFQALENLVRKWNPAINLVSRESINNLRFRHIIDSIQLFRLANFTTGWWCDLGSGGGFPGLVVAILMKDINQSGKMMLVESDVRKSTFLREAARQLDLEVNVITSRIEQLPSLSATVLSARALAALPQLCEFAHLHLAPSGMALFPKGARYQAEVDDAKRNWTFDLTVHPSKTDISSGILEIRNIQHV